MLGATTGSHAIDLSLGSGHRRCLWLLCVALSLPAVGCSQATATPSGGASCPNALADLSDPALSEAVGPELVAGTARVIRFLDSSDPAYRGYDVNIDTRIAGLDYDDPERLVHVQNPIPGIAPGDDVLVFGVRGAAIGSVYPFGLCPPLVPIVR